jgi:hypothetical protein
MPLTSPRHPEGGIERVFTVKFAFSLSSAGWHGDFYAVNLADRNTLEGYLERAYRLGIEFNMPARPAA